MLMLKRWRRNRTRQDLSSLVSSRNAVQFLYEESLANGNADITLILGEALTCGDELIAQKREISYKSKDALHYLYFLRAILGLHPDKIGHLVKLLEWLRIIPCDNEAGKTVDTREGPKTE
jgi:hypothetical protein